ncbi:MAG: universal stress protein [Planctomycetota bacterium]
MDSLFRHIVVPLDFTEKNIAAVQVAMNIARQNAARVTLIHVIESIDYANDPSMANFYETLRLRAEDELSKRLKEFTTEGIPVDQEVMVGKTASSIVRYAMSEQADLVILSSHKIQLDEAPKSWATLSYQVSILCQCPVMLVK